MDIKVVEFKGEFIALIADQNDWTGNYMYSMRLVKGGYGMEYIKYNGKEINVKRECAELRQERNNGQI